MQADRCNMGLKSSSIVIAASLLLWAVPLAAETYRWKDKDGKIHYGATVPADHADLPYDILNDAGLLIEHVENIREPVIEQETVEEEINTREPLIPEEERRRQSDYLLIVQYRTEADIEKALNYELTQLGYDSLFINRSIEDAKASIRNNIRQAADQQRAGIQVGKDKDKQIRQLYARLSSDEKKLSSLEQQEARIRARFKADLQRYRELTKKNEEQSDPADPADPADQG